MDPGIWSKLPEEILDNILSLLPLKTFMTLRSTSFVYDSASHSWSKFDGFSAALCRQGGVLFNGSIYFTTEEPFKIVGFDLTSGNWGTPEIEMPGEGISFARLVSDGDRKLYLVGGVGENGISKTVKLWEFGRIGKWVEIEKVPEMMCRKFVSVCYHNYEHVYCFWHEGMICICCYTWPEILYYKVGRRSWHWLPKCPSLTEKWSCGFRWFSFVPQLHALV
ncbi:F-box/kelch-repeat protein At5g43190 [Linum perenne]